MVRNKVAISKNYHIQPSEIDALQYWEYEYYLEEINNEVEQEKQRQEEEEKNMNLSKYTGFNPADYKMPDMSVPSFNMPSMPSF